MFDITINPLVTKSTEISEEEKKSYLKEFAIIIKDLYIEKLLEYINTKRYRNDWRDISLKDLNIHSTDKLTRTLWISLVKDSISVYKIGSIYKVGVEPTRIFRDSNIPVLSIIRRIEFGTSKEPARPLYNVVAFKLLRLVPIYWDSYLSSKVKRSDNNDRDRNV